LGGAFLFAGEMKSASPPRQRTFGGVIGMSAKCQFRTWLLSMPCAL
jgi:hypothetical protein